MRQGDRGPHGTNMAGFAYSRSYPPFVVQEAQIP